MSFPPDKLPQLKELGIPSTCGCALVNEIQINFWLDGMMYCDYCINTNQKSLTVHSGFYFQ